MSTVSMLTQDLFWSH